MSIQRRHRREGHFQGGYRPDHWHQPRPRREAETVRREREAHREYYYSICHLEDDG